MKPTFYTGLAAMLLLAISCTRQPLTMPQSINVNTQANEIVAGTHFIGEHFGGGIIFYLDGTGQHGLIADTVDLTAAAWYNGIYTITGITKTDIGVGNANTNKIVALQGKPGKYAALECSKSKRSGFTDWYLPSRDELYQLFLNQSLVGIFSYGFYWTSSEIHDSSLFTWGIYFYSGSQFGSQKNVIGFVRAIRSF